MISPISDEIGAIVGNDACGQVAGGELEPLRDDLAIAIDIGVPVELDVDQREPGRRDRAHPLDVVARR